MKQNYKAVLAVATMMGASLAFSAAAQQYGSKPMAPQIPAAQPAANSFTAPQSRPASLYSDWRDYMPPVKAGTNPAGNAFFMNGIGAYQTFGGSESENTQGR